MCVCTTNLPPTPSTFLAATFFFAPQLTAQIPPIQLNVHVTNPNSITSYNQSINRASSFPPSRVQKAKMTRNSKRDQICGAYGCICRALTSSVRCLSACTRDARILSRQQLSKRLLNMTCCSFIYWLPTRGPPSHWLRLWISDQQDWGLYFGNHMATWLAYSSTVATEFATLSRD